MKKFIYTLFLGCIISCSGVSLPRVGEKVYPNQTCFAARTEAAYKELTKAANEKDEIKVKGMMRLGLVKYLYSHEKVTVKHHHVGYLEVECDGKTLFVKDDFFVKK